MFPSASYVYDLSHVPVDAGSNRMMGEVYDAAGKPSCLPRQRTTCSKQGSCGTHRRSVPNLKLGSGGRCGMRSPIGSDVSRRAAGALLVVMAFTISRCGRPPLRVTTQPGTVVIDMQKLGEYPSDVARLRLTDAASNRIVWEVKGRGEPQLGRVQLSVGENTAAIADVRHGSYDVLAPAGAGTLRCCGRHGRALQGSRASARGSSNPSLESSGRVVRRQ